MTPERSSRDAARVFGIVPAAGQSRRMGSDTPKQLLMIRGRRLLEHVIEAMLDGWLDALVVVTRYDIADELDLLEDPRFLTSLNDDPASEMIGSVRIGLQALVQAMAPADADGLLVCPGDMPAVPPEVIRQAAEAYRAEPGTIVVVTHGGREGHPIVLPCSLRRQIEAVRDGGLDRVRDAHSELVRRISTNAAGAVLDIDTPDDLRLGGV